jgi:NTE family protein
MTALKISGRCARALTVLSAGVTFLFTGCTALAPINLPITQVDPNGGYRIAKLLQREQAGNNPEAMVLLAFSGGGTRAAALSYGVLEELSRTPIPTIGQARTTHTLLDEVDLVAGVSGGSFTALAYALYGNEIFTHFEQAFLKRNVQGDLIFRALSPG